MAEHDLFLSTPAKLLLHKDAELDVFSDKRKLGTLKMSKGTIDWVPAYHHYTYQLSWESFDAFMRGTGLRRKKP